METEKELVPVPKGIKLTKEAEKAIRIMREIGDKSKELSNILKDLDYIQANYVGAMTLSIYSPIGLMGICVEQGPSVLVKGLREQAKESRSPMNELLSGFGKK